MWQSGKKSLQYSLNTLTAEPFDIRTWWVLKSLSGKNTDKEVAARGGGHQRSCILILMMALGTVHWYIRRCVWIWMVGARGWSVYKMLAVLDQICQVSLQYHHLHRFYGISPHQLLRSFASTQIEPSFSMQMRTSICSTFVLDCRGREIMSIPLEYKYCENPVCNASKPDCFLSLD